MSTWGSETNQLEFTSSSYASDLLSSLRLLFADRLFCDVVIRVESNRFRAHKTVLGAASPYFKAMFLSGMIGDSGGGGGGGGGGDDNNTLMTSEVKEIQENKGVEENSCVKENSCSSCTTEIQLQMTNPEIFRSILLQFLSLFSEF